ncbi:hypothetical protein QTP88_001976 [Uroleucon formosanum]
MCVSDFKTTFELKLKEITKSECSALISDTKYDELIKEVEQAKIFSFLTPKVPTRFLFRKDANKKTMTARIKKEKVSCYYLEVPDTWANAFLRAAGNVYMWYRATDACRESKHSRTKGSGVDMISERGRDQKKKRQLNGSVSSTKQEDKLEKNEKPEGLYGLPIISKVWSIAPVPDMANSEDKNEIEVDEQQIIDLVDDSEDEETDVNKIEVDEQQIIDLVDDSEDEETDVNKIEVDEQQIIDLVDDSEDEETDANEIKIDEPQIVIIEEKTQYKETDEKESQVNEPQPMVFEEKKENKETNENI